jgi:hypothetical protein
MKKLGVVGVDVKHDGLSLGAPVITEIDIEFEELEQKTAPQSDTTYLDCMGGH